MDTGGQSGLEKEQSWFDGLTIACGPGVGEQVGGRGELAGRRSLGCGSSGFEARTRF